jgi:hypothetical protein
MLKRLSALVLSASVMAACSDSATSPSDAVQPPLAGRELLAELTCKADVAAGRLTCAPASAKINSGALGDLIIGGQNIYVKLTSSGLVNNGTTLSANVTVQNLTVQPWATANGSSSLTDGVRVFFHTLPNNGATVANADSVGTFTGSNQPVFNYRGSALGADGILAAGEISTSKTWTFNLNGAGSFTFQVYVLTKLPDDLGVLKWTQSSVNQFSIEAINAVWGSSSSDVWVGGTNGPNALQRWNGSSWTSTSDTLDVLGLWGSSSTNVYAVGGKKIQRFDGASWTEVSSGASNPLLSIWGSSSTDIYAGGFSGTLVHSTGGAFTPVASTGIGVEAISAIWGSSSSDVYVGATNVYRYNGSTWGTVSTGLSNVRAIWGSSSTDIWMGATAGNMTHYNGTSWTTSTVGTANISGIWGTSATDVYMVNRVGEIWHYNGTSWVKYALTDTGFAGIWGSGRTDVWAVGGDAAFEVNRVYRGTR